MSTTFNDVKNSKDIYVTLNMTRKIWYNFKRKQRGSDQYDKPQGV